MQTELYEGEVTTIGETIGIVPDAAFFRAHPEFQGAVSITVSPSGQVMITTKKAPNSAVRTTVAGQDWGSLKGRITQDGVSGAFFLQTALGESVKCLFAAPLQEKMIAALGVTVELSGWLQYAAGEFIPQKITVEEIAPLSANVHLPTLSSLIGMAPQATGAESAATFVRKLRDGWE